MPYSHSYNISQYFALNLSSGNSNKPNTFESIQESEYLNLFRVNVKLKILSKTNKKSTEKKPGKIIFNGTKQKQTKKIRKSRIVRS